MSQYTVKKKSRKTGLFLSFLVRYTLSNVRVVLFKLDFGIRKFLAVLARPDNMPRSGRLKLYEIVL